ncbi:MAG: type 4a pilus biogenesis protein PilO [Patescibacteria group bacterium]|nr:type 4a pilus biogenesis protein PilO [Patescibacteria group bacterium]MCL5224375.1 type 4a pilus biogenesis protein PilO [Patescibacteria group bacterium]
MPAYDQVQNLRGEQTGIQTTIAQDQQAVSVVNNLLGQYQSLSQFRDSISQVLPTADNMDTAGIVYQIQGLAGSRGLTLQSLTLQNLPTQAISSDQLVSPVGSIQISLTLSGPYQNFKAFLGDLETNIRLMDVSSINISGGGSATNSNLVYAMVVKTYYQQ